MSLIRRHSQQVSERTYRPWPDGHDSCTAALPPGDLLWCVSFSQIYRSVCRLSTRHESVGEAAPALSEAAWWLLRQSPGCRAGARSSQVAALKALGPGLLRSSGAESRAYVDFEEAGLPRRHCDCRAGAPAARASRCYFPEPARFAPCGLVCFSTGLCRVSAKRLGSSRHSRRDGAATQLRRPIHAPLMVGFRSSGGAYPPSSSEAEPAELGPSADP
jgi:hypothetical protein